ncbi:MAG: PEP-CTERM sorting domain-containing protein [Pseudomonadota bacterium]
MKNKLRIMIVLVGIVSIGASQAALLDRGAGLIYDTELDITWLQNANFSGDVFGWDVAINWAANFSYYDSVRDTTWTDWRLPTTLQTDATCLSQPTGISYTGCTGSELGHLFYIELGGVAGHSLEDTHNANFSLFSNIQNGAFWSGTAYHSNTNLAWFFSMHDGSQGATGTNFANYLSAWAVRDGDVAVVPEPGAWALFSIGLAFTAIKIGRQNRKF